MSLRGKQIRQDNKMYDNKEEQEEDYVAQSQARQNGLKAVCKALEYDLDINPETILQNKSLARILSGLP